MKAICKTCGKEFEYEYKGGRLRKFCSTKCSVKFSNMTYHQGYWTKRYREDAEWREKRLSYNNELARKKRADAKEEAEKRRQLIANATVQLIREASTLEEAIEIFEEKALVRKEYYKD